MSCYPFGIDLNYEIIMYVNLFDVKHRLVEDLHAHDY